MCGIAGCISFQEKRKVDKTVLQNMSDAMAERGPEPRLLCL